MEENEEEEKEPINIEFTEQNQIFIMMEMQLTLNDQMYMKTRKILFLTNFIESLQQQNDEENFFQKSNSWMFDDCGFVPNEKKK